MITTISTATSIPFGIAGHAPASPQSARGESVIMDGQRTELVAASQANAPLYDQRAQLSDANVAARTQAGEQTARLQQSQKHEQDDRTATPTAGLESLRENEVQTNLRVESMEQAEGESEESPHRQWMRRRALQAYTQPQSENPPSGELYSTTM